MSYEFIKKLERKEFNSRKNSYVIKTIYKCLYCNKEYKKEEDAKLCIDKHDLIFLPIATDDLARLQRFLYTKNDNLITESLVRIVSRFVQSRIRRG